MSEEDHGPTCAESPSDHYCGASLKTDDADQGVTWDAWSRIQSGKLQAIAHLHKKIEGTGGLTNGCCNECGCLWPCPTLHIANGWGDGDECYEAEWCSHAGVRVE